VAVEVREAAEDTTLEGALVTAALDTSEVTLDTSEDAWGAAEAKAARPTMDKMQKNFMAAIG